VPACGSCNEYPLSPQLALVLAASWKLQLYLDLDSDSGGGNCIPKESSGWVVGVAVVTGVCVWEIA